MNHAGSLPEQKALIRHQLRDKLSRLGPEERGRRSQKILERLFGHPKFSSARSLLTYVALESEVETRPVIEEARKREKKVCVPRIDPGRKKIWVVEVRRMGELEKGLYGILEPAFDPRRVGEPGELDLVIVPGIGFDREGGRLGRGEGYFDRFLQEAKRAYKIGLAFECQIVDEIPREADDVKVDEVLTG